MKGAKWFWSVVALFAVAISTAHATAISIGSGGISLSVVEVKNVTAGSSSENLFGFTISAEGNVFPGLEDVTGNASGQATSSANPDGIGETLFLDLDAAVNGMANPVGSVDLIASASGFFYLTNDTSTETFEVSIGGISSIIGASGLTSITDPVTEDALTEIAFALSTSGVLTPSIIVDSLIQLEPGDILTPGGGGVNFTVQIGPDSRGEIYAGVVVTGFAESLGVSVPEPTTLALMGLGLAGIGYKRHRSKKAE